MADFSVSTMFKAIDKVSKVFGKQSRAATLFGNKATRAFNKASRSGNKFGSVLKGVLGANAIGRGFGLIARGVRNVINEFIDFDDSIVSASAKFKGLNLATKEGQATFEKLRKTARSVGETTQFTSSQAASGLDFLALAGFNAQQAMATLPGTVNLATVANIDLARSTDIATDALGAFNLKVDDTEQLQKNFTRLNDVMALTMARTNTNIEDMFDAIKKGAPAFTSAGQSLESFNALLGVMANSGVKGAEAGTQLRNMLSRLAAPSGPASKIIKDLNIDIADSEGNFRDVVDIISDFQEKMKGMGEVAKTAALATVFGLRGITGQTILLAEGADSIREFRDELINAGGTSVRMADVIRNSLGNRLKALNSAFIELGFKILEAFDKRGRKGIDALTAAVRKFDAKPVVEFLETSFTLFKSLFNVIKPILPFFPAIVKGLIAVKIAMIAVNIAMLANPAGIVIASIGLIVFALTALVLEWSSVVGFFNKTIRNIKLWFIQLAFEILTIGRNIGRAFGLDTSFIDDALAGLKKLRFEIKNIEDLKNNKVLFNFPLAPDDPRVTIPAGFKQSRKERNVFINASGEFIQRGANEFEAPNKTEVASKKQIDFNAFIELAGAPSGTTVKSKTTGAPPVNMKLAGAN